MDWTTLKRLIAEAEQAAYQRGVDDTVKRLVEAARAPISPSQAQLPLPRANGHADKRSMIEIVHELIKTSPGLRGTALVDAMMAGNPGKTRKSMDRTVRTALLRLKARATNGIENRDGGWYIKESSQLP